MLGLKISAFVLFCCVYAVSAKSCSFNLDDLKTEPVILAKNGGEYSYFQPLSKTPEIEDGAEILLVCAGKSNKITKTKEVSLKLTCNGGKFEGEDGKTYTIKDTQCKKIPTADIVETEESCADNNGHIFNIGFPYLEDQFEIVFQICYNKDTKTVYYTHHTVNGKSIPFSISESKRKSFSAEGMGETTTKINKFYTTKNQISRFEEIFGNDQTYVSSKHFIARGHMNPDADGVFRPQQFATYFYMNAQPQYQDCNAGNWLRVESLTRDIATQLATDLDVYTGVLGELQFPDANGNMATAYIDTDDQMPVPEYYFKVVSNLKTDSSIVFIASNNPWATEVTPFCKDICAANNLANEAFSNAAHGVVFCCALDDFKKHYDHLPKSVSAKKVLSL